MTKQFARRAALVALAMALILGVPANPLAQPGESQDPQPMSDAERAQLHELAEKVAMTVHEMPDYGAFDWIKFYVSSSDTGATVTMVGFVSRTRLKFDAADVVKNIDGVTTVNNGLVDISGDRVARETCVRVYDAIYRTYLSQYSAYLPGERAVGGTVSHMGPHPIHILVQDQTVTLEGWVHSNGDKATATEAVKRQPFVEDVVNDLVVVPEREQDS